MPHGLYLAQSQFLSVLKLISIYFLLRKRSSTLYSAIQATSLSGNANYSYKVVGMGLFKGFLVNWFYGLSTSLKAEKIGWED